MKIEYSKKFVKEYKKLTPKTRAKVDTTIKQLATETTSLRSSGMGVRKMVNHKDIYEARIDAHYRITFQKEENTIIMRRVGTHEIYKKP